MFRPFHSRCNKSYNIQMPGAVQPRRTAHLTIGHYDDDKGGSCDSITQHLGQLGRMSSVLIPYHEHFWIWFINRYLYNIYIYCIYLIYPNLFLVKILIYTFFSYVHLLFFIVEIIARGSWDGRQMRSNALVNSSDHWYRKKTRSVGPFKAHISINIV